MRNLIACLTILALVGAASAATVTVPTVNILAGSTSETVTITVTGGELIAGAKLWVQIGATGQSCPDITDVDLVAVGLVFAGEIDVYTDYSPTYPGLSYCNVAMGTGNTAATGNLAIVHIDTTGYAVGQVYALAISGTIGGVSMLIDDLGASIGATLVNGQITLVPEPATLILLGLGGLGMLIRRRR